MSNFLGSVQLEESLFTIGYVER